MAELMEQHEQHVAGDELDKLLALLLRQVFYARMLRHELRVVSYAEPELAHFVLGGRSRPAGRLLRGGWGRWRCLLGCLGAHRCGANDESGKCPARRKTANQRAMRCLPIIHRHLPRGLRFFGISEDSSIPRTAGVPSRPHVRRGAHDDRTADHFSSSRGCGRGAAPVARALLTQF